MSKRLAVDEVDSAAPAKKARMGEQAFDICKALGNSDYDFSPILVTVMEQAIHESLVHLVQRPMDRSITSFPQVSKKWEGLFKLAVRVLYGYLDEQFAAARAAFPTFGLASWSIYNPLQYPWWNKQVRQLAAVQEEVAEKAHRCFCIESIPRGLFLRWVDTCYPGPCEPGLAALLRHRLYHSSSRGDWARDQLLAATAGMLCKLGERHPLVSLVAIVDYLLENVDTALALCETQPVDEVYALLLLFGLFTSSRLAFWKSCDTLFGDTPDIGSLMWRVAVQAKCYKRVTISWTADRCNAKKRKAWAGEVPPSDPTEDA